MIGATYTGVHAIGWNEMVSTWAGRALVVLVLVTIGLGVLYGLYGVGRRALARWRRRHELSAAPTSTIRYINALKDRSQPLRPRDETHRGFKTFTVYLGKIDDPPSETQRHILSHWDVVVVNSFKQGVVRAVHKHGDSGYFLARLDVQGCLEFSTNPADDRLVHSVGIISNVLVSCLKVPDMQQTPFHGVVLTNWEQRFGPAVLSHLLDYINHLGLMVWLEISTSGPVDVRQYEYLTMSRIEGIIYRNGTLSPDGTHRDYFQMSQVRSTMRALAAQKPAGSCHFAMMEVVDDDVVIPHHVLRRTFKWCNYNSAMSWIAPRSALMDAEVAASRRLVEEPLSALAWLKNDALARIHDRWRLNDAVLQQDLGHDALFEKLNSFLPDLSGRVKPSQRTSEVVLKETEASIDGSDLLFPRPFAHLNPFSISPSGVDYTGLGCFQLGLQCSPTEVKELLEAHVGLRDLDLLERVQQDELDKIALELRALLKVEATKTTPSTIYSTIRELINLLSPRGPKANDELRVWVGLHSGFRTRNEAQVWGMYGVDSTRGTTDIYLSNKVTDRTGTILHTFLSSHGFTRFECLLAETMLAESNNRCCPKWGLAPRLVQDIEQLTPAETLRWMRHLDQATCYESSGLVAKMLAVCEYQLLDAPSLSQLRRMSSVGYLNGRVAAEELVQRRLQWYEARGCSLEYTSALAVFKEINVRVEEALTQRDTSTISQLTAVMETVLQPSCIEARADFLAMSVLCAARKIALGEILLEVLDRNPRPNLHHVQAACFAEFYAVGARCDAYFDMTPNELGRILFDRIRSYLKKHPPPPPPPPRPEQGPELPTTYASMDVDLDPSPADYEHTSVYYRITSLGIFAIPALIDIILLTTVGRGLYLSAFMDDADKTVATAALMVSLLLGGAFGTWITSGGSYYMCSMAFPATSMFVMTRFVAGLAVVLTIGTATCIGIGIAQSFRSGVIFLIYLVILTTYLMVVSAMSIYEMQGQGFQSGRLVIVTCVPLLLVSPLLTTWLHHDIVIYPSVLAIFLVVLLIAARRIISKWNSWYLGISCVTDEEVIDWYQRTYMSRNPDGTWKGELPPYSTIRQTLWDCVKQGQAFRLWQRSPPDEFVERLAKGHPAVILLLTWYCKYMGTRLPLPYSTTWNLQLKSAIESLVSMQKGLKQHSSFLHWVHSGQEVWGGLLYFALALMDKWTALFTGESIVGLSISSETYRLAVGFGLAYYLAGAIILDAVSKPLWALAHTDAAEQVSSLDSLRHAISNTKRQRRALYWSHLFRYSLLHVWGLAVTTALLWAFESSRSATQMYLAYVGAYSGLLWYQYSRIYARHRSDRALALGTMVGFTTCILLRLVPEGLSYSGVIGLAAGTWTAALLSFLKATVGWAPDMINGNAEDLELATYTRTALDTEPEIPQSSLARTFGMIMALPLNLRRRVDPSQHPRIKQILLSASRGQQWRASRPFLGAEEALRRTAELWESGRIAVEIVCARSVVRSEDEGSFRSLSKKSSGLLHIIVITPSGPSLEAHEDISHVIAEALVSSTAENIFGWSHHHAILAEPLVHNHDDTNGPLPIPEGVQRQLQFSRRNRETVISRSQESVLHHLLLGVDVEQEWDLLPHDVRTFLLQRARGQPHQLTNSVAKLMSSRFKLSQSSDAAVWLARSDLSASLAVAVGDYAQGIAPDSGESEKPDAALLCSGQSGPIGDKDKQADVTISSHEPGHPGVRSSSQAVHESVEDKSFSITGSQSLVRFYHKIKTCIKFAVLSLVADPEYQRELHYMIRGQSSIISWGVQRCLTAIWLFCKALQDLILPLTLLHGRDRITTLYTSMKEETATIDHAKQRMDLVTLDGRVTCFMHSEPDGSFQLHIYSGRHHQEPSGNESLVVVNTYTSNKVLRGRDEYDSNGVLTNSFAYEYAQSPSADASREVPIQRLCLAGKLKSQVVCYDRRGYIVSGSTLNGTKPTRFRYWYTKDTTKSARQILRAEYAFPAITIEVVWGVPRGSGSGQLNELSPFPRVTAALFLENDKLYNAVWTYDERFQATLRVTLNGAEIPIPPMISDDWFEVLQRPRVNTFHSDNPLSPFPSRIGALSRLLKHNVKRYPVRISRGRSHLWQSWKSSNEVDAVTAKWLDERILRSSYILKPYWKQRDRGELEVATEYLNANAKAILPELDLTHQVSSWVPLGMRFGDLRNLASSDTQILSGHADDTTSENLHVLAMDTGTWPNEPGGVSACRRDLVDNLSRIRWHILAESANDFGIPRFQVERNVDSLTILPQWGLDFLHPTHGIFQRSLYSAIAQRTCTTTDADIQANFIPIVRTLVRCARMDRLGTVHVKEATQALVDLNDYFETRSWNNVWMSDVVKQTWRELWLSDVVEGAIPASQWLEAERPTISQLDNALDMWHRYLFIFSIPVPENIPTVFQASHHFTGATFGVLCKIKRKCTLQVWDHCISFREITAFLSSAVSLDSIFVNNALISLGHLSCVLVLHHADMVLPCAEYFNPGWEIELGTCEGTLQHRRLFNRKINAVVNGIANMEKYKPAKDAKKTGPPTVIMLSHVRYVKDIKTAILAADVLVNHWGFRDYRLNVFGDMQRSPGYSSECQQMIDAKDLRGHVFLKGLGDPLMALEDAWLFMNSSISEGLPLAMGEAALAGLPVVCTDVGSSFSVVTDPTTGQRFSEVVAPNDPTALARAQINILALLGPWASFAEDEEGYIPPSLSLRPSRQDVERISQRMYDKAEQRRKLGLLGRANTYKNFSSERYLREHEQMLRLGDYRSRWGATSSAKEI